MFNIDSFIVCSVVTTCTFNRWIRRDAKSFGIFIHVVNRSHFIYVRDNDGARFRFTSWLKLLDSLSNSKIMSIHNELGRVTRIIPVTILLIYYSWQQPDEKFPLNLCRNPKTKVLNIYRRKRSGWRTNIQKSFMCFLFFIFLLVIGEPKKMRKRKKKKKKNQINWKVWTTDKQHAQFTK